jgi:hypothetical protein
MLGQGVPYRVTSGLFSILCHNLTIVVNIGVRDGGGRCGSCPPQKITKSKSRANVQHKSGKKWEIKKRKSPQFVGQTKAVGQYLLNSWAILAYCSSGKIFGPLKWYTDRNFFGDGGGGGGRSPKLICSSKIFSGVVGHNPKKSGKFLSAPLIFSFPYAHGCQAINPLSCNVHLWYRC